MASGLSDFVVTAAPPGCVVCGYYSLRAAACRGGALTQSDRGGGLDRLDGQLFVLMILSRTARSAAAFGGQRSLTRSSTRTECCPSDQGRFLGAPDKKDIEGNAYEKVRG